MGFVTKFDDGAVVVIVAAVVVVDSCCCCCRCCRCCCCLCLMFFLLLRRLFWGFRMFGGCRSYTLVECESTLKRMGGLIFDLNRRPLRYETDRRIPSTSKRFAE